MVKIVFQQHETTGYFGHFAVVFYSDRTILAKTLPFLYLKQVVLWLNLNRLPAQFCHNLKLKECVIKECKVKIYDHS